MMIYVVTIIGKGGPSYVWRVFKSRESAEKEIKNLKPCEAYMMPCNLFE